MAGYNTYFPQTYSTPYVGQSLTQNYNPTQSSSQSQLNSTGINWVQGEAGARSVPVPAGQKLILMDSESNVFYVKSSDSYGMPLPLRTFKYEEITNSNSELNQSSDYITRKEFEQVIASLKSSNTIKPKEEKGVVKNESETLII